MDIKKIRKFLYINSQYCSHYFENREHTVLAGILRNIGYKFSEKFEEDKLIYVERIYRKYVTILNILVGIGIITYVYGFLFPNYEKLLNLPYFISALMLSLIPLVGLYLIYISINYFYEKFLNNNFGDFKKIKFQPNIYNVDPISFERYLTRPAKSIYAMVVIVLAFLFYSFTPIVIKSLNQLENYKSVKTIANIYLKFVPISSQVYADRAFAKYNLGNYQEAVKDFELANKYSNSDIYDNDIAGVKTYYLPFDEMINLFDEIIEKEENQASKYYLLNEKALYLVKNKKYNEALVIYNKLIKAFEMKEDVLFAPQTVYHFRGVVKSELGDKQSANNDFAISKKMCPECLYNTKTKLIRL